MLACSKGTGEMHVPVYIYTCVCGHTRVINGVDFSMAVDEFLHHALHSQSRGQDQWGRSVIHTGIQICCTVTDQDLKDKK